MIAKPSKAPYIRDHLDRSAYLPLLRMLKNHPSGQWHSLPNPPNAVPSPALISPWFCRFDELNIPKHSTLCRNRQAQDDTLSGLLHLINRQLTKQGFKVKKPMPLSSKLPAVSKAIERTVVLKNTAHLNRCPRMQPFRTLTGKHHGRHNRLHR